MSTFRRLTELGTRTFSEEKQGEDPYSWFLGLGLLGFRKDGAGGLDSWA